MTGDAASSRSSVLPYRYRFLLPTGAVVDLPVNAVASTLEIDC
jgi:hypothetical protein